MHFGGLIRNVRKIRLEIMYITSSSDTCSKSMSSITHGLLQGNHRLLLRSMSVRFEHLIHGRNNYYNGKGTKHFYSFKSKLIYVMCVCLCVCECNVCR